MDDLIQEGCLGLMEAISRFDPERGTKFLTYAVWWIRKFMQETASIVLTDDEVCLSELGEFSLPQVYGKSPEQIVLQAETYAELHDGLEQISARERTYLLYRYGFTDGDEHPIPDTAAHFHLTEKRAQRTEQTALDDLRRDEDEGRGLYIPFAPSESRRKNGCCRSIPPPAFLVRECACARPHRPFPAPAGAKGITH